MPELPEVAITVCGLQDLIDRQITDVGTTGQDLRDPFPENLPKKVKNQCVESVEVGQNRFGRIRDWLHYDAHGLRQASCWKKAMILPITKTCPFEVEFSSEGHSIPALTWLV